MRGESFQNAMAVILAGLLVAGVPLVLNALAWWPLFVPILAAVAVAAWVFLPDVDVATPRVLPQEALRSLAQRFEREGRRAVLVPAGLTVRIDALAAVRLRARITDRGTVVSYQTRASPLGGALAVVLIALAVTAIPAAVFLLFLRLRVGRFARGQVPALLPEPSTAPRSPDEIRGLLVDSLAAGERLARQAFETQRSAYWDVLLDVLLAGLLSWIAVLIGVFVALNGFNLGTGDWTAPLSAATAVAAVLVGGLTRMLRARYRPQLSRYSEWADRLGLALARELSSRPPEPSEPSAFELLASASELAPDWIETQRSAGMSTDPVAGFALLLLSAMAFSLGFNAVPAWLRGDFGTAFAFAAASGGLAAGAAAYARHWTRLRREQLARLRSDWDAHARALRGRMDEFLEEL